MQGREETFRSIRRRIFTDAKILAERKPINFHDDFYMKNLWAANLTQKAAAALLERNPALRTIKQGAVLGAIARIIAKRRARSAGKTIQALVDSPIESFNYYQNAI